MAKRIHRQSKPNKTSIDLDPSRTLDDAPKLGQRVLNVLGDVTDLRDRIYEPISENQAVYERLYTLYRTLHDAFGTSDWDGKLDRVMKEVIAIRAETRSSS